MTIEPTKCLILPTSFRGWVLLSIISQIKMQTEIDIEFSFDKN